MSLPERIPPQTARQRVHVLELLCRANGHPIAGIAYPHPAIADETAEERLCAHVTGLVASGAMLNKCPTCGAPEAEWVVILYDLPHSTLKEAQATLLGHLAAVRAANAFHRAARN
jgi:hypothetical protein